MPHLTHESSGDSSDPVSALLARVLETPSPEQDRTLAALCAQHPECAASLRRAWSLLQQLDLAQVAHVAGDGAATAAPVHGGLPRMIGPFRLLEFLGAGGMGSVYRAEDTEQKRMVAIKLIRGELFANERTRTRFEREWAALARLDHPGLCTVYRAGVTDGQPWIAMRLLRGTTLAQQIERRQVEAADSPGSGRGSSHAREELQRTLLVFEKVARALATAHAAGVVHRDLKPANLVLTDDDEPVVIDFGLVHLTDSETQLTMSGDHIGTPAYMAPEQVAARGRDVTPATDVYALALTMFEALTLTSPFHARGREELFVAIARGERKRLRQARRSMPVDLEVVLEKALDVDPRRRYASMREFADDLARVRRHEPPAARRLGLPLRGYRWCQRNPVAATGLLLLSAGLAVALVLDASRQRALRRLEAKSYGLLSGQLLDQDPDHALELALRALDGAPNDAETLGTVLEALHHVRAHESMLLPWPTEPYVQVTEVVGSRRGDAALILGRLADASAYPAPVLWRPGSLALLPTANGAFDADWSPDGERLVTTCPFGPPQLWSSDGTLRTTFAIPDAPPGLRVPRARFLIDGQHLVFACGDGDARIHHLRDGTWRTLAPSLGRNGMPGLALSGDGRRLAVGNRAGKVVVHEVDRALAGEPGRVLIEQGPEVNELDLNHDGALLQLTTFSPPRCSAWTWEGKLLKSWGTREAPATAVPLDPSSPRIIVVTQDHMPQVFEWMDGDLVFRHEVGEHEGKVTGGFHSHDGRLMTLGVDGSARLADVATGRTELQLRGFAFELLAGAFLGDGNRCLLVTTNRVELFDLAEIGGSKLRVGAWTDKHVAFVGAPWPGRIASAGNNQTIRFSNPEHGRTTATIDDRWLRRASLRLSPGGRWLASTNHRLDRNTSLSIYGPDPPVDKPVATFDALDMDEPQPVFGPEDQLLLVDLGHRPNPESTLLLPTRSGAWQRSAEDVQQAFATACRGAIGVEFHAPTSTLAVGRDAGGVTLYRWQASPPELVAGPTLLRTQSPRLIAFSPDGSMLLLSCKDRSVRLVDRSDHVAADLRGHLGTVVSIDISPRNDRFLIAATDSGITVHDFAGRLLLPIRPVGSTGIAKFTPEGDRIFYSDSSRTTRIVPFEREAIVGLARGVKRPPMSPAHDRHYRRRAGADGGQ